MSGVDVPGSETLIIVALVYGVCGIGLAWAAVTYILTREPKLTPRNTNCWVDGCARDYEHEGRHHFQI